jgi:flagellar biosynthesis protein FlhF
MRLKSYFSGTVEAAMELARKELGEEALLVNARPATPETRYLGAYEVVFGIPPRQQPAPESLKAASPGSRLATANSLAQADTKINHGQPSPGPDRLALEIAGLKRDMQRMLEAVFEARGGASSSLGTEAQSETLRQVRSGSTTEGSTTGGSTAENQPGMACEVDSTLGRPGAARAIVALVGPPGVGKTTTLIKLAARYGLSPRKPAQILSADVFRIAAADQLRTLASILGIGCDIAETAGALAQMLEEHRSKELIFVDTPGLARADMDDAEDLAHLIASHPEIDTHLVLPAFMRASDMARIIDQYAVFKPRKLLFTRLDETGGCADLVREAARRSIPISFLANGQQIPDDLEPADLDRLALWAGAESPRDDSRSHASRSQDSRKLDSPKIRGAAA